MRHVVKLECFFENEGDAIDFFEKLKADKRVHAADSTITAPDGTHAGFDKYLIELKAKQSASG